MNVAGVVFREYGAKAAAVKELDPAIKAASVDGKAALLHAGKAQASVSVLTGTGTREASYVFGKFLAPAQGGIPGRLFHASHGGHQAAAAADLISAGITNMRAQNSSGAVRSWTAARSVLTEIATRLS